MSHPTAATIPHIPVTNPAYGSGIYRRRVRLTRSPGAMLAEMEDCNHGFKTVVEHDGEQVSAIRGEALRTPLTTCNEALSQLQRLVGASIRCSAVELNVIADARANCTHWLDLTVLAINQIPRESDTRLYDVAVTDEINGLSQLRVYLDGELVHDWRARGMELLGPGRLAGCTLFRGFATWASKRFEGDELESALVLQRGNFVAQARRKDPHGSDSGQSAKAHGRGAVCYSYSPGNVERATHPPDSVRDFTDAPEQLLRFV